MILVTGDVLVDLIQRPDDPSGQGFTAKLGGSCYNVALAAGRLGAEVSFAAPLSTDTFGDQLAAHLAASGAVATGPRVAAPTSLAVVTLSDGQPSYGFYRNGTADRQVDRASLDSQIAPPLRVLHIGSLGFEGGEDAEIHADMIQAARNRGIATSIDPNIRPNCIPDRGAFTERLFKVMGLANLVKLSDEDIAWLYPDDSEETAVDRLRSAIAPDVLVLTRGARGALLMAGDTICDLPANPVARLVDTVGAGDTFMGALLTAFTDCPGAPIDWSRLTTPDTLTAIGRFAAEAAAHTCGREGCDPPARGDLTSSQALKQALGQG